MTKLFSSTIRIVISLSVFLAFELAVPLHAYAASQKQGGMVLHAVRQPVVVKLVTTKPPKREMPKKLMVPQFRVLHQVNMVVTAYSSTPDQCSGDPFITATGARVRPGTFAINGYPFGTKLRIPDHFGDRIFVVEDRMSSRYGKTRGDIWMNTRKEALQWGARHVRVEIVEEVKS